MMSLMLALALATAQPDEWPKGDIVAPNLPRVTHWHFVEIDGKSTHLTGDLFEDDGYAITFVPGAFVGYGGCDRFDGTFTRQGDQMTIKPHGRGEGPCAPSKLQMQNRLFEILVSKPLRVSTPDSETLLLTGASGTIRLKRTRE